MIILTLLLPVITTISIIFIVVAISKKEKGGEDMFKQLYVYLVLFATLMMSIGGGIGIFMGLSDLVSPSSTYYQTYSEYKDMRLMDYEGKKTKDISEEELRSDYKLYLEDQEKRTVAQAKNSIIKSIGFILIPFPIFLYFNRMRAKKEE